jgi:multiple sugar transport system permease protein
MKKAKKYYVEIIKNIAVFLILVIFLFPLFWMYITSIKPTLLQMGVRPVIFFRPVLGAYIDLFQKTDFLSGYKNSVIVILFALPITLTIGSLASYSISRFRYKGVNTIALGILNLRLLPVITIIIPIFILFRSISLLNTKTALVIMNVFANLPLCVWLMQGFFDGIPKEIEEAALVDGLNYFGIFMKIVLPLSYGGIFATGLTIFVTIWNEFLFALILTHSLNAITAPVIVASMLAKQGLSFGKMCAATSLLVTPTFILALFFGKYLVKGITMGAVKG